MEKEGNEIPEGADEKLVEQLRQELTASLLTPEQAARVLGVQTSTVQRYLRNNELGGIQLGGRWWTSPEAIRAFVQEAARVTKAEAEAKGKYDRRSRTSPHQRWALGECPECGHNTFIAGDYKEQGSDHDGEYLEYIERRGACEMCGYSTVVDSNLDMLRDWADARRHQLKRVIGQRKKELELEGKSAAQRQCDVCGAPILLLLANEEEWSFTGECLNCTHVQTEVLI